MIQREIASVTSRTQHVAVTPRAGTLLWIFQRLSAYGLLFFMAVHLYVVYFSTFNLTTASTTESVRATHANFPVWFALNELLLLFCVLFHGLNGLRNIIYDWTTNEGLRRVINLILAFIGIVAALFGIITLWYLS